MCFCFRKPKDWKVNVKNVFIIKSLFLLLILTLPTSFARNFVEGQMPDTFLNHRGLFGEFVSSIAFSPDGRMLASGSSDDTIRLWNPTTGEHIRTLEGHTGSVNSVAFSPDGTKLASGSSDETIRLWNPTTGEHIRTLERHTDSVNSVAFSPDGTKLASGSSDTTIRLWNVMTGEQLQTRRGLQSSDEKRGYLNDEYNAWGIRTVAFSPDGSILAIGEGGTNVTAYSSGRSWLYRSVVSLWDLDSDVVTRLPTPLNFYPFWIGMPYHDTRYDDGEVRVSVGDCSFSPDGSTLACAVYRSSKFDVDVRDRGDPDNIQELALKFDLDNISYPGHIEITPQDEMIIREPAIELWDVTSGRLKATLKGHTKWVNSLAFSPDGQTLVSGSGDKTIKLWDVTRQPKAPKATLSDHSDSVSSVVFSPDGQMLASGSYDNTVRLWKALPPANADGIVNIADLIEVAQNFGQVGENDAGINGDGVVNIVDLILVAVALGEVPGAPAAHTQAFSILTAEEVGQWLTEAKQLQTQNASYFRGILFLEQLLALLTPQETVLLTNYPNPFNPETWIPYQLSEPADVTVTIYAVDGAVVRTLKLGHQPIGIYQGKSRAAYWDGRNTIGEPVASGVYFYTLKAGDFTATRKMLIMK